MKKVLLSVVMLVFAVSVNGQKGNFSAGVNLGLPTADASDGYSFTLGAEVNYLFDVSSDFKAGVSASYLTFFGKDIDFLGTTIEIENAAVLPIAGAVRYLASDKFSIGVDLGYAIGISPDGNDGGFYYRPLIGYNLSEKMELNASYSGISVEGGTIANFGLGLMFKL
jgi:hypothetical protein